jgi:hypothetical protein
LSLSPPDAGSVVRYAYLWADERGRGREEGRKDRPSLVLTLSIAAKDGQARLLVLAITHTVPALATDAIAIPASVKHRIGLDQSASWIVTTEANAFLWPGPDIRPIEGRDPSTFVYGQIPDGLLQQVAQSFLGNRKRQRGKITTRE